MKRGSLVIASALIFASCAVGSTALAQTTTQAPGQAGQFQAAQPAFTPLQNPYGKPMSAANLTAPLPFAPPPEKASGFDAALAESRQRDSGRGLSWFWVDATGGFETVGLHTFNAKDLGLGADVLKTEQSGGATGGAIGARLAYLVAGVEGRVGIFTAWKLGRVGGMVGLRLPFGIVEPRFSIGGGYAALAGLSDPVTKFMSVHGGYARAAAGLDIYPVSRFSVGAETSFDFMALQRPAVSAADLATLSSSVSGSQAELLAANGSGLGATFAITGVVGLHL